MRLNYGLAYYLQWFGAPFITVVHVLYFPLKSHDVQLQLQPCGYIFWGILCHIMQQQQQHGQTTQKHKTSSHSHHYRNEPGREYPVHTQNHVQTHFLDKWKIILILTILVFIQFFVEISVWHRTHWRKCSNLTRHIFTTPPALTDGVKSGNPSDSRYCPYPNYNAGQDGIKTLWVEHCKLCTVWILHSVLYSRHPVLILHYYCMTHC